MPGSFLWPGPDLLMGTGLEQGPALSSPQRPRPEAATARPQLSMWRRQDQAAEVPPLPAGPPGLLACRSPLPVCLCSGLASVSGVQTGERVGDVSPKLGLSGAECKASLVKLCPPWSRCA